MSECTHPNAEVTGECSDGCCDRVTCPDCGKSWLENFLTEHVQERDVKDENRLPMPGLECLWHEGEEVATLKSASAIIRWGDRGWMLRQAFQDECDRLRARVAELEAKNRLLAEEARSEREMHGHTADREALLEVEWRNVLGIAGDAVKKIEAIAAERNLFRDAHKRAQDVLAEYQSRCEAAFAPIDKASGIDVAKAVEGYRAIPVTENEVMAVNVILDHMASNARFGIKLADDPQELRTMQKVVDGTVRILRELSARCEEARTRAVDLENAIRRHYNAATADDGTDMGEEDAILHRVVIQD